jgi:hypothetical protein
MSNFKQYTTMAGTFMYPHLTVPDTKYKSEGEYNVKLRLSAADAAALKAMIKDEYIASIKAATERFNAMPPAKRKGRDLKKARLGSEVYDDNGNATGEIDFSFKMIASGTKNGKAWSRRPAIFDAKCKPVGDNVQIWGGTTGKINFIVMPYYQEASCEAGISLKLENVQIIKLNSGSTQAAVPSGFTVVDDGFDADEYVEETVVANQGEYPDESEFTEDVTDEHFSGGAEDIDDYGVDFDGDF